MSEALLAALRGARHRSLFATELAAGRDAAEVERTLDRLERSGQVLILAHAPPDVHLAGTDLRTVAVVDDSTQDARVAAEARWADFVRTFLASHRCG